MSVAEAMLAGCIPIVSRNGALPEVVGDTGVYLRSNSPLDITLAIRQALKFDDIARQRAREQIITHFPLERRAQALRALVGQAFLNQH
jgi:glycosyltransferase involved in cell wall biosynthesis